MGVERPTCFWGDLSRHGDWNHESRGWSDPESNVGKRQCDFARVYRRRATLYDQFGLERTVPKVELFATICGGKVVVPAGGRVLVSKGCICERAAHVVSGR